MTSNFEDYHFRIQSLCVQEASLIGDKESADLDWQSVEEVLQPIRLSILKDNEEIIFVELAKEDQNNDVLPELCKQIITKYERNELESFAATYLGVITIAE